MFSQWRLSWFLYRQINSCYLSSVISWGYHSSNTRTYTQTLTLLCMLLINKSGIWCSWMLEIMRLCTIWSTRVFLMAIAPVLLKITVFIVSKGVWRLDLDASTLKWVSSSIFTHGDDVRRFCSPQKAGGEADQCARKWMACSLFDPAICLSLGTPASCMHCICGNPKSRYPTRDWWKSNSVGEQIVGIDKLHSET